MVNIQRIVITLLIAVASVAQASTLVDNFRLLDHQGQSHELYYYGDAPALAIYVHGTQCVDVADAEAQFSLAAERFQPEGVEFFMLNSEPGLSREGLAGTQKDIPVLLDDTRIIGGSLNTRMVGEVIVIDPRSWNVVYRGGVGAMDAALGGLVNETQVEFSQTAVSGCAIEFPSVSGGDISYADDVAPILMDKCVSCHQQGGIGSWAMFDYNMVRGFSLMIREVVRTKRMPPWHADPDTGHWSNDRSLTTEEVQTLVSWVEAGAPNTGEADPLAEANLVMPEWEVAKVLGEPDYVIELPATEVPATGVVDYIDLYVDNPIGRDVWVQAAEILPGDRTVLHHTISMYGERTWFDRLVGDFSPRGALRHYAPGISNRPFPENTGVFLPADASFEFQMHYTTTGLATVDQTKVGIWVYDEPPEHSMQSFFIQNRRINIPAHADNHREEKTVVVPKDALLYSLLPHAHYRGKAAEFRAFYPDGTEELLLSVPNYDFNWQTAYEFSQPKFVPAGTKLVQTNWWDNSARNRANPDPTRDVEWGDQSWEEMLFGEVTLRFLAPEETAQLASLGER